MINSRSIPFVYSWLCRVLFVFAAVGVFFTAVGILPVHVQSGGGGVVRVETPPAPLPRRDSPLPHRPDNLTDPDPPGEAATDRDASVSRDNDVTDNSVVDGALISRLDVVTGETYKGLPEELDWTQHRLKGIPFETAEKSPDFESLFHKVNIQKEQDNSIKGGPFQHLEGYRNPCWIGRLANDNPYAENVYQNMFATRYKDVLQPRYQLGYRWRMRCLPLVYFIGVSKCGTTDMHDKVVEHPDIIPSSRQDGEERWWNRERFGHLRLAVNYNPKFTEYVDRYDNAGDEINLSLKTDDGNSFHDKITMDSTPHYLWDYEGWETMPAHRGLREPKYTLPHTLKPLVPQALFFAILREPVSRLFSQFRMISPQGSAEMFHDKCVQAIELWRQCVQDWGERSCAYNASLIPFEYISGKGGITLRAGLYSLFLGDWMEVYPRDRFLVIKAEEYYGNRTEVLGHVFRHLQLRDLTRAEYQRMDMDKIKNSRSSHKARTDEPMLTKTNVMLKEFYRPFNEKLAALFGDKFLWKD